MKVTRCSQWILESFLYDEVPLPLSGLPSELLRMARELCEEWEGQQVGSIPRIGSLYSFFPQVLTAYRFGRRQASVYSN